jgi:hypothetical protein
VELSHQSTRLYATHDTAFLRPSSSPLTAPPQKSNGAASLRWHLEDKSQRRQEGGYRDGNAASNGLHCVQSASFVFMFVHPKMVPSDERKVSLRIQAAHDSLWQRRYDEASCLRTAM